MIAMQIQLQLQKNNITSVMVSASADYCPFLDGISTDPPSLIVPYSIHREGPNVIRPYRMLYIQVHLLGT
jgi:hypothetical protein